MSSGATRPARAPPSIAMLQIVIRPSIESAADRLAGIFHHIAGAAVGADLADQRQHHVLGGDAGRRLAVKLISMFLAFARAQRLRRQHVLDLGRADAERQRAERAMRGGVAIAADDRHAGLRPPLLRPDHVHDAVADIAHREKLDPLFGDVLAQRLSCSRASASLTPASPSAWPSVGVLWSAIASVRSGRRTLRPAAFRPAKACGVVTSWMRCRSI